jgi:D-sedoheptulose 7-phosphate isomerase
MYCLQAEREVKTYMSLSIETQNYTERVSNALKNSSFAMLEEVASILLEARKNKRWIFLAGNGGSASTASHFANDMVKGLSMGDKPRFRAKALCDATPIMTALANDYEYGLVYVEQLKNYASAGDVLVLFSGSGNSPNVVNAAKFAKEAGMTVISFAGRDGGKMKEYSDISCIAATKSMEEIEDVHLVWGHALATVLRSVIEKE